VALDQSKQITRAKASGSLNPNAGEDTGTRPPVHGPAAHPEQGRHLQIRHERLGPRLDVLRRAMHDASGSDEHGRLSPLGTTLGVPSEGDNRRDEGFPQAPLDQHQVPISGSGLDPEVPVSLELSVGIASRGGRGTRWTGTGSARSVDRDGNELAGPAAPR
jgi:hypothetical protein